MNRKRFRNYLILLSMAAAVLAAGLYLHMRKKNRLQMQPEYVLTQAQSSPDAVSVQGFRTYVEGSGRGAGRYVHGRA